MKILYVSLVDISQPTGPGTNELEFVNAMQVQSKKHDDESYCLTIKLKAKPQYELENHYEFEDPNNPPSFTKAFKDQASYLKQFKQIINKIEEKGGAIDLFVIRLAGNKLFRCIKFLSNEKRPFAIKHFHTFLNKKVTGINTWIDQYNLSKICKRAICIDTTWQKLLDHLNEKGIRNVALIDNGTNVDNFFPGDKQVLKEQYELSQFSHIISYIGGVPLERGAAEIIKSVPLIKKEFPNAGFLIIGDNKKGKSHIQEMEKMAAETGFSDSIIIKGFLPFEQVPPYFQLSDVGVALVPEEIVENFGNSSQKIYQYLASGTPVVVPKNCHSDLLDKGFVADFQYKSIEEFANHVIKLLNQGGEKKSNVQEDMHRFVENNYSAIGKYEERRDFWLSNL
ncbi:glycosyltransferase [Marivirga sp. S37H4]|uniref:Glycosyltransferase n=1 Tax=Marivirga aurantiaca TaxID=2802615 RepID=A0A934WWS1_9BACT|nr:glycosyltransferase [Marivirga aurantiaca]MBK6264524.1 glycosyltransferase [Marivirga aurantiaca]